MRERQDCWHLGGTAQEAGYDTHTVLEVSRVTRRAVEIRYRVGKANFGDKDTTRGKQVPPR